MFSKALLISVSIQSNRSDNTGFFCKLGTPVPADCHIVIISLILKWQFWAVYPIFRHSCKISSFWLQSDIEYTHLNYSKCDWFDHEKNPLTHHFWLTIGCTPTFHPRNAFLFFEKKHELAQGFDSCGRPWARLAGMVGSSELQRVWRTGWIEHQEVRPKAAKTRGVAHRTLVILLLNSPNSDHRRC